MRRHLLAFLRTLVGRLETNDEDSGPGEEAQAQYEYQKALHAAYVKQRETTDRFALEIAARYERMLSLITGGALAFSLTFIEKIASKTAPYSQLVAAASWGFLTVAVVANLCAIYQSQKALRRKMDILDLEMLQEPSTNGKTNNRKTDNPHAKRVGCLSLLSLLCTVFGVFSLLGFVIMNFPTTYTMNEETNQSIKEGSYSPSKPQAQPPLPPPAAPPTQKKGN